MYAVHRVVVVLIGVRRRRARSDERSRRRTEHTADRHQCRDLSPIAASLPSHACHLSCKYDPVVGSNAHEAWFVDNKRKKTAEDLAGMRGCDDCHSASGLSPSAARSAASPRDAWVLTVPGEHSSCRATSS